MGFKRLGLVLAAILILASLSPARAASWLELNFWLSGPRYDAVVPHCEAGLGTVASRFAQKEGRFWNSSLQIVGFEDVRETAFMPWLAGAHNTIPRRFCSAIALVSDGVRRPVYYSIAEDAGFAGMTWGVEWCVVGLDRNWAYNPACRAAKPGEGVGARAIIGPPLK